MLHIIMYVHVFIASNMLEYVRNLALATYIYMYVCIILVLHIIPRLAGNAKFRA